MQFFGYIQVILVKLIVYVSFVLLQHLNLNVMILVITSVSLTTVHVLQYYSNTVRSRNYGYNPY